MRSARRPPLRLRLGPRAALAVAALLAFLGAGGVAWAAFTATTSSTGNAAAVAGSWTTVQAAGTDGCVSDTGSAGACADGRGLDGVLETVVDPQGRHLYAASNVAKAVAAFSRDADTGALTQLAGTAGCASETGADGCADVKGLADGAGDIAISPDGAHVYVSAGTSDGTVAVFARDAATGALTQLPGLDGCVSDTGTGGDCRDLRTLRGAVDVTVAPDGRSVYVVSDLEDGVANLIRDPTTGALSQAAGTAGCVTETGSGGTCADGRILDDPRGVVVSPDGLHAYVASATSNGVAALTRNGTTGALSPIAGTSGCASESGTTGTCVDGRGLLGARGVVVGSRGTDVYVASATAPGVAHLRRDPTSGGLSQAADPSACWTKDGSAECQDGIALAGTVDVALDPRDGRVWVAADGDDAVATFYRHDGGILVRPPGTAACITETGSGGACADGRGLDGARHVAAAPDGSFTYVSASVSDAIVVLPR